ncbi:Hypothetical protein, putative [Bodo saltans]|uniref:Uncharacterized protein n=1 Tax=Bodo saltans TaxID=75058 RepID=A0A0S4J3P8_BODSA|nr:Hypothetical protein, putative [Bodo saltans]|eukprot:CUG70436.1 Hypothetical protein, putative [Bodo saltans]
MLQFSLRPRPPHSIPPHGRPMEKEESTPYTLSPQPCVHEWYDEFVVPNAPEVLQAKHASMVQSLAALAAASSTSSLAAHRAVMVGGVSCWDDIRKHGSRYLVGTAAHPPPAPPSDDEMILSSLKVQLRAAIAQLRADVAPSLLSSLRLKPTS